MTQNNDEDENRPTDIRSVTASEHAAFRVQTNLFSGEFSGDEIKSEMGVQVHRDGPNIGLRAGTTWTDGDSPALVTYQGLTSDQAREIGEALIQAADKSDEIRHEMEKDPDSESLVRRLLG